MRGSTVTTCDFRRNQSRTVSFMARTPYIEPWVLSSRCVGSTARDLIRGATTFAFWTPSPAPRHEFKDCSAPRAYVSGCAVLRHPRHSVVFDQQIAIDGHAGLSRVASFVADLDNGANDDS